MFLAPYLAVQRSVIPELVGEEQGDVATAAALSQAANRLTIFVGPPLAGVLIAVVGASNVLYFDAASYLAVVRAGRAVRPRRDGSSCPRRARRLDGARFMMRDRLLRIWQPSFTLLDVCWMVFFASLPVLA